MKAVIIVFSLIVSFSVLSCKSGDKCGTCPTFSKIQKVDSKQV